MAQVKKAYEYTITAVNSRSLHSIAYGYEKEEPFCQFIRKLNIVIERNKKRSAGSKKYWKKVNAGQCSSPKEWREFLAQQ